MFQLFYYSILTLILKDYQVNAKGLIYRYPPDKTGVHIRYQLVPGTLSVLVWLNSSVK